MSDKPEIVKFKVLKQSKDQSEVIVEVEKGSVVYERISKVPTEYLPLSPIENEPDKTAIIDGDKRDEKRSKK
jgi:hypothetical protein